MIPILLISLVASAWGKAVDYSDPMINARLFEGDIMRLDSYTDRNNAVAKDSQRWPGGVIPYVIDESLDYVMDKIMDAMKHIQDRSCIRFTPRTNQKDYLRMVKENGCWSSMGKVGTGEQKLSLGAGCENKGIFVHEFMHAIGFEHEHSRSDRDDYIIIHWENIDKDKQHNFYKLLPQQHRLLTDFDYDSIMLYGSGAFSSVRNVKTMESKDGRKLLEIYEKPGLSETDIKRIKMLYECQ